MKPRFFLTLLLVSVFAASCGGGKKDDPAAKLAELKKQRADLDKQIQKIESTLPAGTKKATPVSVLTLQSGDFSSAIEVQANIVGDENVVASPQAPGIVTRVLVQPGQRVGRGQTLAVLDAGAIEQQIAAMDAQVKLLRDLYSKQQKLWAQNIGTEVQLMQARANYENITRQRAALSEQRGMYRVVSPISGTVDEVNLKVGDMAQPGGGMNGSNGIRIVNLAALKAEARLGENYLGKVKAGDPVTLVFSELGDSIRTKLTYVAQSLTPSSRSFMVQARLGSNAKLRPNMSAQMKIANYQAASALSVPVQIIQKTPQGDFLFVAEGGKAKAVTVETGKVYNGQVEILAGLKPGDKVIVEGYQELDNGKPVTF